MKYNKACLPPVGKTANWFTDQVRHGTADRPLFSRSRFMTLSQKGFDLYENYSLKICITDWVNSANKKELCGAILNGSIAIRND